MMKLTFANYGLATVYFRSLSNNVCYEGDKEWQRDTQTSFGVMPCGQLDGRVEWIVYLLGDLRRNRDGHYCFEPAGHGSV